MDRITLTANRRVGTRAGRWWIATLAAAVFLGGTPSGSGTAWADPTMGGGGASAAVSRAQTGAVSGAINRQIQRRMGPQRNSGACSDRVGVSIPCPARSDRGGASGSFPDR